MILALLTPLLLWASEPLPFDLTYPTVTKASEIKQQDYDRLAVWIDGEGYHSFYGHTWEQKFTYPKSSDDTSKQTVKAFIAKNLQIEPTAINKDGYAHAKIDAKEYWIKLSIGADSYSYILQRIEQAPERVTLDSDASYVYKDAYKKRHGEVVFAKNRAIAHVKDYAISRVTYKKYDEYTFYYGGGHLHKGVFWNIDFQKSTDDPNSDRYSIAHDYKAKLLGLGASVLEDKDNTIKFRFEENGQINIIRFGGSDSSFSITIIQEEPFKQSLVLTPDSIKSALDKEGKITLDGIYFDFNKATLKTESDKAILSTAALMQTYSDLVLSVHGHTDAEGSDSYNLKLSAERAASVRDAIIAKGIESARLLSKGYGESEPIASNDTDEGRSENRRVELHKVSGGDKKSIITIDFIKPLENSVVMSRKSYQEDSLSIQHTKPYSTSNEHQEFKGHLEVIEYDIIKDGKADKSVSRKEIIKNYANVLELYNAELLGDKSNNLYFKIKDRGDGVSVYGRIEAYTASYTIKFLIQE